MTTIKEKCQAVGIALPTYYFRIKQGMTPEQALSVPNKRPNRKDYRKDYASAPAPEPVKTLAPTVKYGSHIIYVFEKDWQEHHRKNTVTLQSEENVAKKVANPQLQPPRKNLATTSQLPKQPAPEPQTNESLNFKDVSLDAEFNRVMGGYTAVILNTPGRDEYKYQITGNGVRLYTSSTVKFVNTIIRICDPQGKIGFKVIEV